MREYHTCIFIESKYWLQVLTFCEDIVEASVKVKFAYVYNSTMTQSGHLHTDYEHAQTLFSRVNTTLPESFFFFKCFNSSESTKMIEQIRVTNKASYEKGSGSGIVSWRHHANDLIRNDFV
jgi:hypothetical protein